MILPDKHTKLDDSLLALGSQILKTLKSPETVSRLWEKNKIKSGSFKIFSLSLTWLYIIGAINIDNGIINRNKYDI